MPVQLEAQNVYAHSGATYADVECQIAFAGMTLAVLRATDPFNVPASRNQSLSYVASVEGATLDDAGRHDMEAAIRDNVVEFSFTAQATVLWKFVFVNIHHRSHFSCTIRFSEPPSPSTAPRGGTAFSEPQVVADVKSQKRKKSSLLMC